MKKFKFLKSIEFFGTHCRYQEENKLVGLSHYSPVTTNYAIFDKNTFQKDFNGWWLQTLHFFYFFAFFYFILVGADLTTISELWSKYISRFVMQQLFSWTLISEEIFSNWLILSYNSTIKDCFIILNLTTNMFHRLKFYFQEKMRISINRLCFTLIIYLIC